MEAQSDRSQTNPTGDEIARLRERLAFYESFDQVIHENVSHSSDLLRKAAASQEEAHRALAAVTAHASAVRHAERARFRELFSAMLTEVSALQGQLERVARRVVDTLDDLETDALPELAASPPASASLTAQAASPASSQPSAAVAAVAEQGDDGDEVVTPPESFEGEDVAPGVTSEDLDASEPESEAAAGAQPFSPEDYSSSAPATEDAPARAAETTPDEHAPASEPSGHGGATILVHGVPRATMALSLKRFLEGLPQVDHVEPREYAEGVLRLLVIGRTPVSLQDLRSWPDGAALEPVNVRADLLEVRLGR